MNFIGMVIKTDFQMIDEINEKPQNIFTIFEWSLTYYNHKILVSVIDRKW